MGGLKPLATGDLVAEEPVIQGGMGVGINLHKLVGAIAEVGGMGITPTAQIGLKEPDFTTNSVEVSVGFICGETGLIRETAPQGTIGLNIVMATKHYDMWVKEVMKAGTDITISGAELPVSLLECVEAAYAEMKGRPAHRTKLASIVSSVRSAMVIRKMWDRKCHTTPDLVVAEGPLAGGHLGLLLDQLSAYGADTVDVPATYDRDTYDREVKAVMKVAEEYGDEYGRRIPVVTVGGIYTHEDVIHQLEPDTDGVQVATRSVTTEECDAPDAYKQTYINAGGEDIVITQNPVGTPGRAISNPFLNRIKSGSRPAVRPCFWCLEHCDIRVVPYRTTVALVNATEGDTDHDLLFYGSNTYRVEEIDTAGNVMKELTGELI